MSDFAVANKRGQLMARLDGVREIFWLDAHTAACTNHRYVVRYPSKDAADRGAAIYNGASLELPE